jgi:hypothetical protein
MSITTYRTAGGLITLRMGSEGPMHDPYGFTEIKVVRNGHKVIYHQGLGEYLEIDGEMLLQRQQAKTRLRGAHAFEDKQAFIERRFEEATGWSLGMVVRAIRKADQRRHREVDYVDVCAAERAAGWDPNP